MLALLLLVSLVCSAAAQLPTECGVPTFPPTLEGSRILSETQALPYSWPWMAQVSMLGYYMGGASIITKDWALTSARITTVIEAPYSSIRAGRLTQEGTNEPYQQSSAISTIIVHEDYSVSNPYDGNDIALVRVQTPFTFNDYVSPVCLADSEPVPDSDVWATGWGNVQGSCCRGQLKQAKLSVVERAACSGLWMRQWPDKILCAGNSAGSPAPCGSDEGGPLVGLAAGSNNKFYQHGIISVPLCYNTLPNLFINVAKLKPWILSKLSQVETEEALLSRNVHFQPRMGAAFRNLAKSVEDY